MAKKAPNPITFAKQVLRRASYRLWYARNAVLKRCQVSRGVYRCECCGGRFKKAELEVDHIDPVVDIKDGYENLETWTLRLLVPPEKMQGLCSQCHSTKTAQENEMREFYKQKKKKK